MESEARNRGVPFADVFWERLAAAAAAGEPNARELIDIQKQAGNRRALDL